MISATSIRPAWKANPLPGSRTNTFIRPSRARCGSRCCCRYSPGIIPGHCSKARAESNDQGPVGHQLNSIHELVERQLEKAVNLKVLCERIGDAWTQK